MSRKNKQQKVKSQLEKYAGKRITTKLLSPADKVEIMEFLLQCQADEVTLYTTETLPMFVVKCAKLLLDGELETYFNLLLWCKHDAKQEQEKMSQNKAADVFADVKVL